MNPDQAKRPAPTPASPPSRVARRITIVIVLVLMALLAIGIVPRLSRQKQLAAESTEVGADPIVNVEQAHWGDSSTTLSLPASLSGLHETGLYARTNGFVRAVLVDMGSHVRAGQALAEIETPELDQELGQARANLEQVLATGELARATFERWKSMVQRTAATQQELEEKQATYNASMASANAARANVERLVALKGFASMVAPFAGVVTARNIDVGALVSPGAGAGTRPLFALAQVDTVRVLTAVPQNAAPGIKVGLVADVYVQELTGGRYRARVTRTAQSLDPGTRTLMTELQVANHDGRLLPGMFANVTLTLPRGSRPLLMPANALMMRPSGPQVAIVVAGHIHLANITLGRDYGTELEVLSGLTEDAQLVVNPGDDMVEGSAVRIAAKVPDKR